METAMHTDNPVLDAARHEDRAQAKADARDRHFATMRTHYAETIRRPSWRESEIVNAGPWCPVGSSRRVTMAADFAAWVMETHPNPDRIIATLFMGRIDTVDRDLLRYADERAAADADALVVEP
jgi:hypothetical protein